MSATYTIDQVAEMLGVGRKLVYESCDRKEIPHLRLGRKIVFPKAAIDRWLDSAGDVQDAEPVASKSSRTSARADVRRSAGQCAPSRKTTR